MNSYRVYYKEKGTLHCMRVDDVPYHHAAIIAVKEHLLSNNVPQSVVRRVFAVIV